MTGHTASGPSNYLSESKGFTGLKKRSQFLRVAKGRRFHGRSFTLQTADRADPGDDCARIGLTVTKKTGGSVERNRIRRRLRAALRLTPGLAALATHDYVIVARREALSDDFGALRAELTHAFGRIHEQRGRHRRGAPSAPEAAEFPTGN